MNCFTCPYREHSTPRKSCSMSDSLPSLLVHLPLDNCLAAWAGVPAGFVKMATFSKPGSSSPFSHTEYFPRTFFSHDLATFWPGPPLGAAGSGQKSEMNIMTQNASITRASVWSACASAPPFPSRIFFSGTCNFALQPCAPHYQLSTLNSPNYPRPAPHRPRPL